MFVFFVVFMMNVGNVVLFFGVVIVGVLNVCVMCLNIFFGIVFAFS